jgi:hypothetical protein
MIECQVDRLGDIRLGGHELHLEAGRDVELLELLLGSERVVGDDVRARLALGQELQGMADKQRVVFRREDASG